jgi:hypothetical protein
LALSFVNQVGAPNGMNQAAPGSFIPESFVRWSQDVLYDRVGYLRRRAPYKTQALYSYISNVWALDQPSVDGERIIGLVTTRNPNNEDRIGIIVTNGTSTSIIFYDTNYHKMAKTDISVVANDGVVFTRPALSGGAFIGILDNYGVAKSDNKHYLYYWRGGTGVDSTVANCTLGITDDALYTQATDHSAKTITQPTHAVANGYPIVLTDAGATGLTVGTTYYVVNAGATTFQLASSVGGSALNIGSSNSSVIFYVPGHITHTNQITGTFNEDDLSPGMFVYRVSGANKYYLGVVKSFTSGSVNLEKDIIRTLGFETNMYGQNTGQTIEFLNVRPYVHNHGRGLITRNAIHGFTITSGSIGTEGEGHFASADLAGTTSDIRWALYRASDGKWIGDVESVTNNAALLLSDQYHSDDVVMNADEYVARPYTTVYSAPTAPDPTRYTGVFTTTYAGYQWYADAGSVGNENRIVFSAYHDPESVDLSKDAADSIIIPGSQQIRGIATSLAGLVVFLEDKTYIIRGNYRANFSLEELYPEGCLSAQSVVEYGGGVFWASKNGILFYDGASVRNLTETNLGSYYTDSIKGFDAFTRRIYGFFYKDYLFMTFTGFISNYAPFRYEPLYADTLSNSPQGLTLEEIQSLDPSFTNDDFSIEKNTPIYWQPYTMYKSEGVNANAYSGYWGDDAPDDNTPINNKWGESAQFVWGPVNFIENMTFAIYLPSNAITAISNFDFRGFIKLDTSGGTLGYAGINAVDPDNLTGTYARLIDVDSMLDPTNTHTESVDSELSENTGKQPGLYYKGPDFYLQTKHFTVGDPVLKKWFRQVMLNLYLIDGAVRMDLVDNEDNDDIDITKKRQRNWAILPETGYSWEYWESRYLNTIASPDQPTWGTVENLNRTWVTLLNSEFSRRKKKVSWRYPSVGFRLYQMNDYRPPNYQGVQRPHTLMIDSWNIGFKPMRVSRA